MGHLFSAIRHRPQRVALAAMAVSAAVLIGAHFIEHVLGHAPCPLCLDQREAHWAALAMGLIAVIAARVGARGAMLTAGLGAMTLIYVFSAGLAGYHAGAEWGLWQVQCDASVSATAADPAAILADFESSAKSRPACDRTHFRLFGLSLAGYNAMISGGLALLTAMGAGVLVLGPRDEEAPQQKEFRHATLR